MSNSLHLQTYLQRIRYMDEPVADLNTLKKLQQHHLLSIPFENLDIHLGKAIRTDVRQFYEKMILHNRGGFCYELNGLFYELLCSLGFKVDRVSACVWNSGTGEYGPEFDHLALVVSIEGRKYLCDVGFGEFAGHPLEIEMNITQQDPRGKFLIEPAGDHSLLVLKVNDSERVPEYKFSLQPRALEEFSGMCLYHQTSPDSHFTRKKLISLATPGGRITLTGNTLRVTENGKVTDERELADASEYQKCLLEFFGVGPEDLAD